MTSHTLNAKDIAGALFARVRSHPERIALDYYGKKFTYKELGSWVKQYAAMVRHLVKNKSGERIALFMPNIPQFVFAYYGAIVAHAYAVPINFASIVRDLRTKPIREVVISDDIKSQLFDSDSAAIIVADALLPVLLQMDKDFLNRRVVLVAQVGEHLPAIKKILYPIKAKLEDRWVPFSRNSDVLKLKDYLEKFKAEDFEKMVINPEDAAQILYTTGTTGIPKGVILTHKNLISNTNQCLEHLGDLLEEGEVVLSVLPLFHSYGLIATLYMTILGLGGKVVLLATFTPKDTASSIKRCRATIFPAVSKIFQRLCDRQDLFKNKLSSLKFCISGAGRLDPELKSLFEKMTGVVILEGYGLSETSPIISVMRKGDDKPGSVGRPVPSTEVHIIGVDDERQLGVNQEGEILVRGPQVMTGYYQRPKETQETFRDGWLKTGDIGYIDEGGFLYITDRKKEMSSISGENVFWHQVETLLLKHHSVIKCAVIGVPDKSTGDAIVAFVVLKDNGGIEEIEKHVKSSPNKLLVPREIIPVSEEVFSEWEDALGKLQKRNIRKYYEANYQ